jgi:DNA-binding response OmpR family regulator
MNTQEKALAGPVAGGRSGTGASSVLRHMAADDAEPDGAAARRAGHTVLVVDDEPASRYATTRRLQLAGYKTVETPSGYDALDLAGQATAVVLDVNLPDLNGVQVCGALRRRLPRELPIVLHSAVYVDELHRDAGLTAGADVYLVAPLQAEQLLATLDRLLAV